MQAVTARTQSTVYSFASNQFIPYTIRPSIGRSQFQTEYVAGLAAQPDFDFFCGEVHCDEPYNGPFTCLYYTKDGLLHAVRVGRKRVLYVVQQRAFTDAILENDNRD